MRQRRARGPWYLITGFILGALLGLAYAWVADPIEYVDTAPVSLRTDFKDEYRALIASAYVANGDLARAEARLALLGDADVARVLAEQAQRAMAEGKSPQDAQALGLLAVAVGEGLTPAPVTPVPSATPTIEPSNTVTPSISPTASGDLITTITSTITVTVTTTLDAGVTGTPEDNPGPQVSATQTPPPTEVATQTPLPTGTPLPTRTPTATPGAPFVLRDQIFICEQNLRDPLIQVLVEDVDGQPVPGVEAVVNWEEGESHFFTGVKPELGIGYADFMMSPGVVYSLRLVEGGEIISDLTPAECETAGGTRYWGTWLLVFTQP
jgi:hypothetical protein